MSGRRGSPLQVFIGDDSPAIADMLTELITDPGRIEVCGVGDTGEEILDSIRRLKPDVVVLDLQLKNGSGTDVIRAVRSDASLAATRLIVASNHTAPQLKAGCLALGAESYYDKVKELGALVAKLGEIADAAS